MVFHYKLNQLGRFSCARGPDKVYFIQGLGGGGCTAISRKNVRKRKFAFFSVKLQTVGKKTKICIKHVCLVVKRLLGNVIEATIMTGRWAMKDVFIPRIPFIPTDYPFEFRRLQFPVKLSYALTINKAQGQTLQTTGLFLDPGCFSHGRFYVGVSRFGNPKNLCFYSPNNCKTKNIVYKQALQ